MASRDLYKRVLQASQDSPQYNCPSSCEKSPMTLLAYDLHSVIMHTPVKRPSVNSTASSSSFLSSGNKSLSSDSNCSMTSNYSKSPSLSPKLGSPPFLLTCDKENLPTTYYSPSFNLATRHRSSPLKDVQNTVNRNLNFSPLKKHITPKKSLMSCPKISPVDDFDTNSQDSGYSESNRKESAGKIDCISAVASSSAPRRLNLDLPPSLKTFNSTSTKSFSDGRRSFASLSCDEDAFLMEMLDDAGASTAATTGFKSFASLISAPIQSNMTMTNTTPLFETQKPPTRRSLSMFDTTPTTSRVSSIFSKVVFPTCSPPSSSFKRPHPPSEIIEAKRRKHVAFDTSINCSPNFVNIQTTPKAPICQRHVSDPTPVSPPTKPKLFRSHSESQVSIMKALNKSTSHEGELTGDFSRSISLPIIEGGKHPDLKAIGIDTMSDLIRGEYKDKVNFKIIDCRYPYEFSGGHIHEAVNWHHPQMVHDHLNTRTGEPKTGEAGSPREVLIFHCEFSAERGPKAQRLLRNQDRIANKDYYPALHFPEMYLLEGGYKVFFEKYPELCTVEGYVRMLDPQFADDLKHFRGKSKSWAADNKLLKGTRGLFSRTGGPKRLGL